MTVLFTLYPKQTIIHMRVVNNENDGLCTWFAHCKAQDDLYRICNVHFKILHTKYLCFSNKLISTLYMSKINIANLLRKPSQKVNPLVQGLTGKKLTTHLNFSCESREARRRPFELFRPPSPGPFRDFGFCACAVLDRRPFLYQLGRTLGLRLVLR